MLARLLVTFATLVTLIGSNAADWNSTHLFSEQWSPHAKLHGGWMIFTHSLLSLYCLYLVWRGRHGSLRSTRVAALIQACIWLAFFPAMLVPGMALADPGKSIARIAGIEVNLWGALGQLAVLAVAIVLTFIQQPLARASREPTAQRPPKR
jgi:hypothetical protein